MLLEIYMREKSYMRLLSFVFVFMLLSCESVLEKNVERDDDEVAEASICTEAVGHLSSCMGIESMATGNCDLYAAEEVLGMSCDEILDAAEDMKEDGVSLLDRLHCKIGVLHFCEEKTCEETAEVNSCIDALDSVGCGQCSYYSCLEERANCGEDGYLLNFVGKYCNRFTQVTYPRLSEFGKVWMSTVRECLIYSMEEGYFEGETCESIEERGIRDHISCYVDSGICSLPLRDWFSVVSTISPGEFPFMQAVSVGINCIDNLLK